MSETLRWKVYRVRPGGRTFLGGFSARYAIDAEEAAERVRGALCDVDATLEVEQIVTGPKKFTTRHPASVPA